MNNTTLMSNGYTQVPPGTEALGVYWVAIDGKAFAVIPPDLSQSCIARVEEDMCALFGARGWAWNDVYVIWQPKDHGEKAWQRWFKKWTARTAHETPQPA